MKGGVPLIELLIENNRPGTKMQPTTVTVHNTANPDTTARNNRDYFANHKSARASTHYVVDDEETIRCIPEDEVSWHAGAIANSSSISLEVCEFTDPVRQQHSNENAASLIADILIRHGWGIEQIRTHKYWTGKNCPRKLLPIWDDFLSMVQQQLSAADGVDHSADPLTAAIDILQSHGVINSPDYWLQNARAGKTAKGEYVYLLLINMAQNLNQNGGDSIAR